MRDRKRLMWIKANAKDCIMEADKSLADYLGLTSTVE